MTALKKLCILFVSFFLAYNTAMAQSQGVAERFSAFDPNSNIRIDHSPLTDFLQATVLPVGRSYRILGEENPQNYRGSRIKTASNLNPSRFEGSRLLVHVFSDGHKAFFKGYQEGLERLSARRPLSQLNKNEQLAYWLNLYNVIVINKVIEEYPIQKTKSFRSTKSGQKSFWDEKVTTVEGVPLSLNDIERIVFANFDNPEAAFGLWQGSVGGPRLVNYAYTGKNVNRALELNAVEFVNSNRGLRPPTGTRMKVSDFYEWTMPAFGNSEQAVLAFIKEYADPNFVQGTGAVTSLSFKIYDWTVADLIGGSRHGGQHNQVGGAQTASGGSGSRGNPEFGSQPGGLANGVQPQNGLSKAGPSEFDDSIPGIGPSISATPGATGSTVAVADVMANLRRALDMDRSQLSGAAIELLMGIQMNNRRPIPLITVEECAPDEECVIEDVNGSGV